MSESLAPKRASPGEVFGRYVLYAPIARGEIATVHIARLVGAEGFSRIVAAKRLHPDLTQDPDFLKMFFDDARTASKIRHPNVVPILDIVQEGEEVILILEYAHGAPLDRLLRAARTRGLLVPAEVTVAIGVGLLSGLHAAHETKDELGRALNVVHREVAPPNVLVTVDGAARLLGFGTSEAAWSALATGAIALKGKVAYAAPEQLRGDKSDRRADLFSVGVVLWEMLAGRRLHSNMGNSDLFAAVINRAVPPLTKSVDRSTVSEERWAHLVALEPILEKALRAAPADRYENAAEMLEELSEAGPVGTTVDVSRWVGTIGREYIVWRDKVLVGMEEGWRTQPPDCGSGALTIASLDTASEPRSLGPVTVPSVPPSQPGTAAHFAGPSSSREPSTGGPFPVAPLRSKPAAAPGTHPAVLTLGAALLVAIAVLAGVLFAALRRQGDASDATTAARHAPQPPAPAPVVATTAVMATAVATPLTGTLASPSPPPPPPPNSVAEAARPTPPPMWRAQAPLRFAAPQSRNLPTPTAAVPAAPSAKPDPCDPPFYFEGRKKVYRPGCL